ncbi:MAG TPA: hypothetical protein V6C65_27420 [Allocoleopsis sp.]
MNDGTIVQVSAFPGWIVGVSQGNDGYFLCWVINSNYDILSDRQFYETSVAAMVAGREFVERNLA